ncbi:unnamed protein product, partial [Discosporangium mesarthrocarpum]
METGGVEVVAGSEPGPSQQDLPEPWNDDPEPPAVSMTKSTFQKRVFAYFDDPRTGKV